MTGFGQPNASAGPAFVEEGVPLDCVAVTVRKKLQFGQASVHLHWAIVLFPDQSPNLAYLGIKGELSCMYFVDIIFQIKFNISTK